MKTPTGGQAFPEPFSEYGSTPGMTLRDYFAAKAMAGIYDVSNMNPYTPEDIAKSCYKLADAMIKAREETA